MYLKPFLFWYVFSIGWKLANGVSGQYISPVFNGQAVILLGQLDL